MGCGDKSVRVRRAAWSNGTTSEIFISAARFDVQKTGSLRVSWDLEAPTGDLLVIRAVRYSNDGITWTNPPTQFGATWTKAAGDSWGSYQTTDSQYRLAEVGVMAKNDAGVSTRQQAQLNFLIDTREP